MGLLLFANLAETTLAGSITSTATTANLAAGTGALFPSPPGGEYFCLTLTDAATGLINEVVWVTNVTGDTINMTRGEEGYTALAWLAGDHARNLWTSGSAATMIQRAQLQLQADNYAAASGSANAITVTLPYAPASLAALVGVPVRFTAALTNTGATTLNVNGTGAVNLTVPNAYSLLGGQIQSEGTYQAIYNGSTYQLQTIAPVGGTYYGVDTGSANNIVVSIPALNYLSVGQPFQVKVLTGNTGATTMTLNGTPHSVLRYGLTLFNDALIGGNTYSFLFDGANFQVISPVSYTMSGTGTGMQGNQTMIGWSGTELLAQVDNDPLGPIALWSWVFPLLPTGSVSPVGDLLIPINESTSGENVSLFYFRGYTLASPSSTRVVINVPFPYSLSSQLAGYCFCSTNESGNTVIGPWTVTTQQVSLSSIIVMIDTNGGPIPPDFAVSGFVIGI